jgi:short-subunit dehydrogenase
MSKFAFDGFTLALREELRPRGIRVINVYPAATDTDIWSNVPGQWPREKMMRPEEVAEAVAYALSRPSSTLIDSIMLGSTSGNL